MLQLKKALVVYSGGLDSYVALLVSIKSGFDVEAIIFDYEQPCRKELELASKVCKELNIHLTVIKLTDILLNIEEPLGLVPGRNSLFLQYSAMVAINRDCFYVIVGFQKASYHPYPDTTMNFIQDLEKLINTYSGTIQMVEFYAPLLKLSKSQVIHLGTALGADFTKTTTCAKPAISGRDCGDCSGCRSRNAGFLSAGIVDPTDYEKKPILQ